MNNDVNDRQWLRYIETLRANSRPVRIDAVLQRRMATFVAARQEKLKQGNSPGLQALYLL